MDGKGSWRDNLFIERLWKSVKYEEVYLHGYDSVTEARHGLTRYFTFYNQGRPPGSRQSRATTNNSRQTKLTLDFSTLACYAPPHEDAPARSRLVLHSAMQ
jgi:hypothetical protein